MTDFGTPGSFPAAPMPPSSGDRTGPPWEQPGAFFSRWIDTAKTILLDPMNGFSNVRRTGGIGAPLIYLVVGLAPAIVVSLLFQMLGVGGSMMGGDSGAAAVGGAMLVVFMLIGLVVGFVMFFVIAGIIHLVLSLLGGARHGFEATFRTLAYSVRQHRADRHGAALRSADRGHLGPGVRDHGSREHAGDDARQGGDRDLHASPPVLPRGVPGLGCVDGDDHGIRGDDVAVAPA